jgi:hypothetical protein
MFHDALPLFIGFLTKHMIADYYMQYSWMMKYKGTYGHWKGMAHSEFHGFLTFALLWWFGFGFFWSVAMGLLDAIIHYHIDWTKSNLWKAKKLGPNDQAYWMIHGTDQFLHLMTYVLILHLSL